MDNTPSNCFLGSVTVGERGQVVIPAEARQAMDIKPGDKLLVIRHPIHGSLCFAKLEQMQGFLADFSMLLHQAAEKEATL